MAAAVVVVAAWMYMELAAIAVAFFLLRPYHRHPYQHHHRRQHCRL